MVLMLSATSSTASSSSSSSAAAATNANCACRQNAVIVVLVLMIIATDLTAASSRRFLTDFLQEYPTPGTGPYFDTTPDNNVTGLVGKTVHLVCRVKNLGNRTVSWVRHRDIHLLTVGRYTYTSDQRFEALHSPHTEEWTLRIRYAQKKDSGIYECQISTTPPIGHPVMLGVVEPITEIHGSPDMFINKGSTINLTCVVKFAPEPPPSMTWSHNDVVINFDSPRGGISLVTEKGRLTTSRLLVQKAIPSDSGVYSCAPSNANGVSVRVHILNGEHPAAMHHGTASATLRPHRLLVGVLPIALLLLTAAAAVTGAWHRFNAAHWPKSSCPSSASSSAALLAGRTRIVSATQPNVPVVHQRIRRKALDPSAFPQSSLLRIARNDAVA